MEWFQAIVGALSGGLLTALGGIFYLKSRMQKEGAEADIAKTEASKVEYAHLLERITNAEKMYAQQGEIISELRQQILKLSAEKFESDQKVQVLAMHNTEGEAVDSCPHASETIWLTLSEQPEVGDLLRIEGSR